MCAPASARRRTVARPIPREPPVTMATRSRNRSLGKLIALVFGSMTPLITLSSPNYVSTTDHPGQTLLTHQRDPTRVKPAINYSRDGIYFCEESVMPVRRLKLGIVAARSRLLQTLGETADVSRRK